MSFLTEVSGPPITDTLPVQWIFNRIEEWANGSPNQLAFIADHEDRFDEYRFADVIERANLNAAGLQEREIRGGDRVGILMENTPHWVFLLLGTMRIGAITVPLPATLPEASIRLLVEHSECKLIVADEQNWEKASQVAKDTGCRLTGIKELENSKSRIRAEQISGSDTAILIYTSGTTGNPKGVELTYDNLNNEIRGAVELLQMSPNHRILSVLPFSHVLPLIANGIGPLCAGAAVVFLSSISPQRIIDAFHRHRITFFVCVPQFFYILHKRILSQAASQPLPVRLVFRAMRSVARRTNSTALRRKLFSKVHRTIGPDLWLLASGGSRFEPRVANELSELGYTVLQAYGLTETSAAATITPVIGDHIGTVGKPIRGVTVRLDSTNNDGVGEVWIRGPVLMKGYYHAPEQTSAVIHDGWLRTGDLGAIDSDGFLSITGRSKDVIVLANGENVYPEELEMHYSQSPFIKEMCILGVPEGSGNSTGELLHGIVVPDMEEFRRRGQTAIMEMIRFEIENLSKQVPSFYRIHSLSIRNEPLPRTVTRKLKRFEIQQEEVARRKTGAGEFHHTPKEDHPRLKQGAGAVLAKLVHEAKPEAGALDPSMNMELDLGFDSLGRVELLALAEARLGTHIPEQQATRIFTLGEFVDAFESSTAVEPAAGRSWKEILDVAPDDDLHKHYILNPRPLLNPFMFIAMRTMKLLARMFFGLRYSGLENLPQTMPFLICPNHESYLDGPLLVSLLPRRVIYNMFIHGYADYWKNPLSRRLAEICNIVAIDANVNLVRAMQVAAVGLKHGRALMIFPEGTRSIDGHVAEFKKGAAILAYELGVPIVPVGIRGTFEAWPRGGGFRLHSIEFHFGKPIDPRAFGQTEDPYKAITEKLRHEVTVLSGDSISVT